MTIKKVSSIDKLEELGRVRLSKTFFMRDFLYSEIANWYGVQNFPEHPDIAIRTGTQLCEQLLEPLQTKFGRLEIRSAYRSPTVNQLGNYLMNRVMAQQRVLSFHRLLNSLKKIPPIGNKSPIGFITIYPIAICNFLNVKIPYALLICLGMNNREKKFIVLLKAIKAI